MKELIRQMHLLVSINNNLREWQDTLSSGNDSPRLPLPFAFGAAFLRRGHVLSAIDLNCQIDRKATPDPFKRIYHLKEIRAAMSDADIVALWSGVGIKAIMKQAFLPSPRRRVMLNTYIWRPPEAVDWRVKRLWLATKSTACFSRGVVVMTHEQARLASADLPSYVPVMRLCVGVDTAFYRTGSHGRDVPEPYRETVDRLMKRPYVIMPGDELRCNDDALDIAEKSDVQLVRISQFAHKSRTEILKKQIKKRGLDDRIVVFEGISYAFLRYLLQYAAAYAGLVDSTWQPAGWTVACEALASGLPVVLYEGLVSREIITLGAKDTFVKSVPMNDTRAFQVVLGEAIRNRLDQKISYQAKEFAALYLDLERTADDFVQQLERTIASVD